MTEFKKRSELHLARKVWHITTVSTMALIYTYTSPWVWGTLLALAWIVFVPVDFWRQRKPAFNEFLVQVFRPIMRENEVHGFAGTSYLLTGVAVIVLIFPKDIVLLSLLFLALADPLASYFGIRYGKDKLFRNKSLQGTLAAFVVCTLTTAIYLHVHDLIEDRWIFVSLLGGVIGALAELIPFGKIDDNFTLPVFSSTFLFLVFFWLGALS